MKLYCFREMSLWISDMRTNFRRRSPLHRDVLACPAGSALADDGGVVAVFTVALHLERVASVSDEVGEQ